MFSRDTAKEMFSQCLPLPGKAGRTSYFGTVSGEASTSISGLPQKTLFSICTIFPAPQGKHQDFSWAMYVCEYLLLNRIFPLAQHISGLQAFQLIPSPFMEP